MNKYRVWRDMRENGGAPQGLRWAPSDWAGRLAALDAAPPTPLASDELDELREANAGWGAGPESLDNIEALGRPGARVIVTGQQPGLLAGPLLCVYKTLQAIRLAQIMRERRPGESWIPVFWVAAEDHDFDEIRRAYWPAGSGELEEFLLEHNGHIAGRMIGPESIGHEHIDALLRQLQQSTHPTEFRTGALETLRGVYGEDRTLEHGFCSLLMKLTPGTGLVIVSPLMSWLRRRAGAILKQEFQYPGASTDAIIKRGRALYGDDAPLHRHPGAVNAFWLDAQGRRHTLAFGEDGAIECSPVGEGEGHEPFTREMLLAELEANPESFSLNVATRPLVQDSALPTVAQVTGPGEAAYLSQVEAICNDFGVVPAIRYPRPQFTLIEPRVTRQLEKYGLTLEEALGRDAAELGRTVAERDLASGMLDEIAKLREKQFAELENLKKRSGDSAAVHSAFEKLHRNMGKGYDTIRERILYEHKTEGRQLDRAMNTIVSNLNPGGRDQERTLGPIVPFVFNYGWDWALRLLPRLDDDPTRKAQIVSLSDLTS